MMHDRELAFAALADAGYTPVPGVEPWGRADHPVLALTAADGSPVVAKLYADGLGEAAYAHMHQLWASSFGGLPRPVEYIAEIGALVMERVDGQPMGMLDLDHDRAITAAMEVLIALHTSDVQLAERRTSAGVVRWLRRKADLVAAAGFSDVIDALDAARPAATRMVPSHGDFCPRNLLVSADRMVLIDWDRLRLADPARDVGSFGAWAWGRALRTGATPAWSVLDRATAAYLRALPQAEIEGAVPFYAAASLVRTALILATRPRRAHHVPQFLEEARRLVG